MGKVFVQLLEKSILIMVWLTALVVDASWMGPDYMSRVDGGGFAIGFRNSQEVRFYSNDLKLQGTVPVEGVPTGLVMGAGRLFVTLNEPNQIVVIDPGSFKVERRVEGLAGVCAPVFDAERGLLYVCNRWDNSVCALGLETLSLKWKTKVRREPGSAALDAARGILYVPNRQTTYPADIEQVRAPISLLNVAEQGRVVKELWLPSGCADYRGMAVSPDGATVAVLHNFAKFFQGTFQVEWAWMNSSYVTLIDTASQALRKIVPLDDVIRGAASPWCVDWTPDGERLLVTHAGVHELSVIDVKAAEETMAFVGNPLNFIDKHELMGAVRTRVLTGGNGPRGVVQLGSRVVVANFFTDSLGVIDLAQSNKLEVVSLNPDYSLSIEGEGEMYFNDAMLCKQNWQSCIGCHPDGRSDGFNWDLMNDGLDTFKNTKSLLYAHATPPAMVTGIRPNAEYAVRSGIRAILFTQVDEKQAAAMDAYLKAMRPLPSPYLVEGKLSQKAQAGQKIFRDPKVGCTFCHHGSYYTDMELHDVGTAVAMDAPYKDWDTPTLIEVWRTAPYLHDGSAPTLRDVLVKRNQAQKHGHTEHLTSEELDALAEYVLSL